VRDGVFDHGRATAPRNIGAAHVAFGSVNGLGLCGFALSRLNSPPHTIAVYASSRPSPPAMQHSLPSRRYPLLGRDFHPLDHISFPDALTLADETPTAALSLLGRLISIAVSEQVDHSVEVFLRRERMAQLVFEGRELPSPAKARVRPWL
jgi:hypothetical protein